MTEAEKEREAVAAFMDAEILRLLRMLGSGETECPDKSFTLGSLTAHAALAEEIRNGDHLQ